ncbi:MAG TPA: hypothetical protein VGF17_18905 [Phytomonospora sp.]
MTVKTANWRVTPRNLDRLDRVDGVEPGSVSLHATELDEVSYKRLALFLTEHGGLLKILKARPARGSQRRAEFADVDFAADCPNLKTLEAARITFDETPLAHPSLTSVTLRESNYTGRPRELTVAESPLRKLVFDDCIVDADRLTVAAGSRLRTFEFWLDEDFAGTCPDDFALLGTSLVEMVVRAAWDFTVTTTYASERRVRIRDFRAGRYNSGAAYVYVDSEGNPRRMGVYSPSDE